MADNIHVWVYSEHTDGEPDIEGALKILFLSPPPPKKKKIPVESIYMYMYISTI